MGDQLSNDLLMTHYSSLITHYLSLITTVKWLGRVDSNQRMPVPKTGALPLGYAPKSDSECKSVNEDLQTQCACVLKPRHCNTVKDAPTRLELYFIYRAFLSFSVIKDTKYTRTSSSQ